MNRTIGRITGSLMACTLLAAATVAGAADFGDGQRNAPRMDRGSPQFSGGDQRRDQARDGRNYRRDDGWRDNDRRGDRFGRNDRNDGWRNDGWRNDGWRDNRGFARERFRGGYYTPPRGYYYRQWRRGERLPMGWYSRQYIVDDYYNYRLYAPPRGYHWVRVNNDMVLTAIATGLVLDVLYNVLY